MSRASSRSLEVPRRRVLLVDDETLVLSVFARLLTRLGYEVSLASDGAEALRILEEKTPSAFDVVVADVHMPVMNGIELLCAIRSAYGDVRVVLMSAGGSLAPELAFETARLLGADATLDKTLHARELAGAIEQLLSDRRDDGRST